MIDFLPIRLRLFPLIFLCIASLSLAAQPRPTPEDPPLPKPAALFTAIREAYRSGPIAESVRVVVRRISTTEPDAAAAPSGRRAVLSLMTDPSTSPAPADRIAFRLRGSDRIWIQAGATPATETENAHEPRTRITASGSLTRGPYFQHDLPGPLTPATLSANFPPLPLPQIALAFTPLDQPIDDLTPYARGVTWTGVRAGPSPRPDSLVLEGTCRDGSVSLTVNAKGFRIRSASFVLREPLPSPPSPRPAGTPDAMQILIEVVNRPPSAERWVIETQGRPRAPGLDGLSSSGPSAPEGRVFPIDELRSWSGAALSGADRPGGAPPERPDLPAERIVLLIANQRTAAADPERAGATLRALASALASLRNEIAAAVPAPNSPRPEPGTPRIARFETHFALLLPEGHAAAAAGAGGGVGGLPDWAKATFATDPPLTTDPLTLRANTVAFADPGEKPILVLVLATDGTVAAAFSADAGDSPTPDADIATQLEAALLTTAP